MNRTDRLLAIVLELQGKGRQRAEDLAATFETSKRTIYRDIQALGEAGVPLISVPGRGYSLMKGYFLPPLSFTTEEATMLLLGSDFTAQNFDAQYRGAAQSASRKIEGVLPEKLRDEVHYLQDSIRFISSGSIEDVTETERVRQSRFYFTVAIEESAQGLLVTLQVRQESEILQWLLSWGRHVQVLEPESLRSMMAEEAEGMLSNHQRAHGKSY